MLALDVLLMAASAPLVCFAAYLCLLALLARRNPEASGSGTTRFAVVVPAHDEELGITRTVESLLALDYDADRFEIVVVADNCSDRTAELAAAAGARVLVRQHATERGKGYALNFAFERLMEEQRFDAFVVVDADTGVSPNLLTAVAARLERGAHAVQAHYRVQNPMDSWRTRLMVLALALFHDVRSLARERLGLSVGLRGNGMAFSRALLERVPHTAFSIVEDLEYGIRIGMEGYRVHYAEEAAVFGDMVAGERDSRSQRERWEAGRRAIRRQLAGPLLVRALKTRDPVLFDLAMDLLVLPLAALAGWVALGLGAAGASVALLARPVWLIAPWGAAAAAMTVYVGRGISISGLGMRGVAALLWAPVYLIWKVALRIRSLGASQREWVRTARAGK